MPPALKKMTSKCLLQPPPPIYLDQRVNRGTMDVSNVPRRPPPPPPIDSSYDEGQEGMPLHRGAGGGGYIDSPAGSPPSFADALRGSSPTGLYWQGDRQPIPQEDSEEGDDDDDGHDSPPLYSSSSEAPPAAGLGERLAAFVGYRDHEPEPTNNDRQQQQQQTHHQTPPPPFQEEEEDDDDDQGAPRQPPIIIITGATTGLGLALFKHFSAMPKSSPDVPYDVLGIDKTPWRVPGTGFRWQTPVGQSGMFTQLDLTARPARLENWAQTYLYSQPVRARRSKVRYPRPVRLVVHCAASGARGLVEQPEADDGKANKANHKKKRRGEPVELVKAVREEDLESFEVMNAETMRRTFDANVVATLQLVQMVTPHLQLEASTRDEDLGVLADPAAASRSSSSAGGHDTSASEDDKDNDDGSGEAMPGGETKPTNNLDWLEALKTQGSRASLHINTPYPKAKKEKPPPSAPRDGIPAPRVVVVGSRMGSVAGNKKGGAYAFRASQAALSAVVRSLSIDVPEVCFACVYPGELAVQETKGRPKSVAITGNLLKMEDDDRKSITKKRGKADDVISCEESVRGLLPMFEKLGDDELRTGCFVDRFGEPIPW